MMRVIQFARSRTKKAKIVDSIVQVADGFQEAFKHMEIKARRAHIVPVKARRWTNCWPELTYLRSQSYYAPANFSYLRHGVTLCHEWGAAIPLRMLSAKRLFLVLHTHKNFDEQAMVLGSLERFVDGFIVPSEEVWQAAELPFVKPHYVVPFPHIVPPVVPVRCRVTWVGNGTQRKNPVGMLDAIEHNLDRLHGEVVLLYEQTGNQAYEVAYRMRSFRYACETVRYLIGRNASPALQGTEILLVTSWKECSPRIVVEAGLCGARLVLPDCDWAQQFKEQAILGDPAAGLREALETHQTEDERKIRAKWFRERFSPYGPILAASIRAFLEAVGDGDEDCAGWS